MAIPHAQSNEVVDVRPLGASLADHSTHSIFKADELELLRLVLPAGKVVAPHKAPGEITVHCVEGRVAFTAEGKTQTLAAGNLLFLTAGVLHSLEALEDSSVLVTLALKPKS